MKRLSFFGLALLFWVGAWFAQPVWASDLMPERRDASADLAFGWLAAPTPFSISGIGSALPVVGVLSNIYGRTDLVLIDTLPGGAIDLQGVYINQLPFFDDRFLLAVGNQKNKAVLPRYERGLDSRKEEGVFHLVQSDLLFLHLKLFLDQRRFEIFAETNQKQDRTEKIFDQKKNAFENLLVPDETSHLFFFGGKLDLTDNRLDPKKGIRIAARQILPNLTGHHAAEYLVNDFNLTWFVPFFDRDVLTLNLFQSDAFVKQQGTTDAATLGRTLDFRCEEQQQPAECRKIESIWIKDQIQRNKNGTSTYLGGPNRMRAYDIYRFYGAHTAYAGMEYRYNFSTVTAPLNWILVGGLKTVFQLAFFAEQGAVTESRGDLYQKWKPSYGAGFRAIISGMVYRFDLATGDEGLSTTLFFDYPMDIIFLGN